MQELFDWADYVVVGSGIGAAAFAESMTRAGKNVLVLEAGEWPHRDQEDWNPRSILIQGRYGNHPLHPPVTVTQYERPKVGNVLTRPIVGGMSVFYGGAAFRLREKDFSRWPNGYSYSDIEPYYGKAEILMGVHGDDSSDPTRPPRFHKLLPAIAPSKPAIRIQRAASALGMKPFAIPLAIHFSGARACELCNTCDGFPCRVEAKVDGATLLKDILLSDQSAHLKILTTCFVETLKVSAGRVTHVECRFEKSAPAQVFAVRNLVLGAGAIGSAALMIRSQRVAKPGTFVSAAQFGINLLRHANAIVGALFFERINPEQIFAKQTVIADFYEDFREKSGYAAGVIQDIYTPDSAVVRHFAPRGLRLAAGLMSDFIQNLLCVSEDEPQASNRVEVKDDGTIHLHHSYTPADIQRRDHLVLQAKRILKKAGGRFSQIMQIDSFSHAVATLRMGESAETSASDANGKIWGIENLWVIDGAAIPASGGVNPSLTIAAHAIRVSEALQHRSAL